MARYQVPQNIDMEDKIVGPLTMLQFVYLMIGGMIVYLAWTIFDIELFFIIAVPVGLFTLAMAFIKIQDQPFPKFMASFLLYLVRPKARVWQKEENLSEFKLTKKTEAVGPIGPGKTLSHETSASLASGLDAPGQTPNVPPPAPTPVSPTPPTTAVTEIPVMSAPTPAPEPPVSDPAPPPVEQRLDAVRTAANPVSGVTTSEPLATQSPVPTTPVQPPTPPLTPPTPGAL